MSYNNINVHNMPWSFDSQPINAVGAHAMKDDMDTFDDICPALELNQENISLFNQQQQLQEFQSQYQSSYPVPSQQHQGGGDTRMFFNQAVGNELFVGDHDGSNYTRSDSSPAFANPVLTPETSETSGGYEANINPRLGGSGFSNTPSQISANNTIRQNKRQTQKTKKQLLDEKDAELIARDDSELSEEELQLKRKAQNRAAQRAFRERKETRLKELEARLLQSEEERTKLMEELDLIRKQNISITTENEILRSNGGHVDSRYAAAAQQQSKFDFPKSQDDFIHRLIEGTSHSLEEQNKNKVYDDTTGNKVLALGAVWDYLQIKAEEANLDFDAVDITAIMDDLKGNEKCHGFGPAYPLDLVNQVVAAHLGV